MLTPTFAQVSYISDDSLEFNRAEQALKTVIEQSKYIFEATGIAYNYYYIEADDQTYYRTIMKVKKAIKGADIHIGDTIISIWKQEIKGKGPPELRILHSSKPILTLANNSTSCLFLKDNEYPAESVPDEWSQYKHTTYVPSSIGYFAALYNSNGEPAVGIDGLYFKIGRAHV